MYHLPVKTILPFCFLAMAAITITGCDLARNHAYHDRAANMDFQDFRKAMESNIKQDEEEDSFYDSQSNIPALQSYVADPSEDLRPMPLVSVSLNQNIPLRDALYQMAVEVGYDIELDPSISGAIIFSAKNKPFDKVIEKISRLAGLRYKFEDDSLRLEVDRPYVKTYNVSYVNVARTSSGSKNYDVDVSGGDEDGASGGSSFSLENSSSNDFWADLEGNLEQLLGMAGSVETLRTQSTPVIETAGQAIPPVAPVSPNGEGAVQPPEAILEVGSLPPVSGGEDGGSASAGAGGATFAVNRQAGMVTVFATERQHEKVDEFLRILKKSTSTQVLIEAKVFEVVLSDEYTMGIDWAALTEIKDNPLSFGFDTDPSGRPTLEPALSTSTDFFVQYAAGDISAFANALSRYGTVRALASPRVTVLNGQPAVLTVAENRVFFEIELNTEEDEDTNEVTIEIDSEARTVPEGVLINVHPSVDMDTNMISMIVRPTITRITDEIADPGVAFVAALNNIDDVESLIPEVSIQEMESFIQMPSGQPVVMGGLMKDEIDSEEVGLPVLSEIPVLGNFFQTHSDTIEKSELVVFLKATIIDAPGTIHDVDRKLYKLMSGDRRPLNL